MSNILKKICEDKKKEIELLKDKCSLGTLKKLISDKIEKRNFKNTVIDSTINKKNFIIGEIKKISPSAGEIIKDYDPLVIAKTYENAGVGAISILTESNFFGDELIGIIQSTLSSMPDELRVAVTLREIEGLSYEDISSMMKCPIGTVRSRIIRAREVLNTRIKSYTES